MDIRETSEIRELTAVEMDATAGGCFPVWVNGKFGIEGLSPTLDRNDPRLRDPGSWVQPFGV